MIRYKGFILFLLLMLIGCEQREELISNLSQRQANEIISVLERHNITARKVDGGKQDLGTSRKGDICIGS